LYEKNDQLHEVAKRWALSLADESAITTEFVLLEAYDHFSDPFYRPRVRSIQRNTILNPRITLVGLSSQLFTDALELFSARPDKAWTLTDCTSMLTMERHGVTRALTYDQHFTQAGFEAMLRRDPG
jgi:predicted nucleic acid-binding protein